MRYEPTDLGGLAATFRVADHRDLEAWVRAEPTAAYARRAWFFYEWLTGKTLDVPDAGVVVYSDALDTKLHLVATKGVPSKRHKINDNILGSPGFAPTFRRTQRLEAFQAEAIAAEARSLIAGCDPDMRDREPVSGWHP